MTTEATEMGIAGSRKRPRTISAAARHRLSFVHRFMPAASSLLLYAFVRILSGRLVLRTRILPE
jgi:hypothetical protein